MSYHLTNTLHNFLRIFTMSHILHISLKYLCCCCCLPTPLTVASGGESDLTACGPPASFSVHMASRAVTPVGSAHKSRDDNVVPIWVQLKMCVVYVSVTKDALW